MARRSNPAGTAKKVQLIHDTGSAVVEELVAQLNSARVQLKVERLGGATGATYRGLLGVFDVDMWIRNLIIVNRQNATLDNAATDIFLRAAIPGELDLEGGPATPRTLWAVEGYNTDNFPVKASRRADQHAAGSLGDAVTGTGKGMILRAGEALYVDFVNTEGANAFIDVLAMAVPTDRVELEPDGLQDNPQQLARNFRRSARGLA